MSRESVLCVTLKPCGRWSSRKGLIAESFLFYRLTCNLSRLEARFNLPPKQVSNLQDGDFASAEPRRPYRLARTALSP